MGAKGKTNTGREVKLSCLNVWKVYGDNPDEFFAAKNGKVDDPAGHAEHIRNSDHIVASADVSFDVPFHPLVQITFPTYAEDEVPAELAAVPVTKPGSRK